MIPDGTEKQEWMKSNLGITGANVDEHWLENC